MQQGCDDSSLADQQTVKQESPDREAIRTSVVDTLLARECGPSWARTQRLEQRCLALYAANQQSQWNAETAQSRMEKTKELNRRLCREVHEARTERTKAVEELERLQQDTQKNVDEVKQARADNLSLQEALKVSQRKVLEQSRKQSKAAADNKKILEELQQLRHENSSLQEQLEASQREVLELSSLQLQAQSAAAEPAAASQIVESIQNQTVIAGDRSLSDLGPDP